MYEATVTVLALDARSQGATKHNLALNALSPWYFGGVHVSWHCWNSATYECSFAIRPIRTGL